MRTTKNAAGGGPLAALLFLLIVCIGMAASGEGAIDVVQTLEWKEIEEGIGLDSQPELVDLIFTLRGVGPVGGYPIDCMFVVDMSATADLATTKAFAFDLIDRFAPEDRVGLVVYSTDARLEVPLDGDRIRLKTAIGDMDRGGKSALGDAMQLARRELVQVGREDALLVEILLSDGQSNVGIEPTVEGEVAEDAGIRIVSVGIGSLINQTLLQAFASQTDGLFYRRPSEAAIDEIFDHLEIEIAASDLLIEKQLPDGLRLVSSTPGTYRVETLEDGVTLAQWRVADLLIDQELTFELEVQALGIGAWEDDLDLMVTYTDFRGVTGSEVYAPTNWPPMAEFAYEPLFPTTSDTIVFEDLSEDTNSDGKIIAWEWNFGGVASSHLQNPEFRFTERDTYVVSLLVTDDRGAKSTVYETEITVGNAAPVASFVLRDTESLTVQEKPHLGVSMLLDASASYDLDGNVERYLWDFEGDGIIDLDTESADIEHVFEEPGEVEITLSVVDDEGSSDTVEQTVEILPSVAVERIIDTCLPDDHTIAAMEVMVHVKLSVNTILHGLSISETLPLGWTFVEVDNDGATLRKNEQTMEWLFLEKFDANGVNSSREIVYKLTAPSVEPTELTQSTIHGVLGSSSPRLLQTIAGDDRLTLVKSLPVPVVISRWNAEDSVLAPCLGELIAFDQIQYAVSLWLSGDAVPHSGGAVIDLLMIQDLIAYWLTDSSVHDPLP